jgi:curved DNA-binding protein CbpA
MSLQRDYYEVLGVAHDAPQDLIKKKYRELARKFHPDVVADKTLGVKVFSQINQAYTVLSDAEKRARYNLTLEAERSRGTAVGRPPRAAAAPTGPVRSAAAMPRPKPAQWTGASTPNGSGSAQLSGINTAASHAPQASAANVARLLADAESAMIQNRFVSVRQACEAVLRMDPRQPQALALLGDALVQLGRHEDAARVYRQALQVAPSSLLQAKLNRVLSSMPVAAPQRPAAPNTNGVARNGAAHNGAEHVNGVKPEPEPVAAGFFSRLLGRK